MPSIRLARNARSIAALVMLGALAIVGTYGILSGAIDRVAERQAADQAIEWGPFLAANMDGIAGPVGDVLKLRLYDADGRLLPGSKNPGDTTAAQSDPVAAETAHDQSPRSRQGKSSALQLIATYVPVRVGDDRTVSVLKVVSDLDRTRTTLRKEFLTTSLELSFLIACSFGVPAFAFYWRTRQKQLGEDRIAYLAHHDVATGLLNRTSFTEALERKLLARRGADDLIAVHFIDIDRFKGINDSLGHSVGDELIKAVAERLQLAAGRNDLIARFGGDEFILAQCDVISPEIAEAMAHTLRRRMNEPFKLGRHEISVTASFGVALAPTDAGDVMTLLKAADTAMYRAKAEGRDAIRAYKPEMDAALQQRRLIEIALRDSLESDTFKLHFQPVFEANGAKLLGFEALLRLQTLDGTMIPPTTFIPIAEEMGLISRIGTWVLKKACKVAATWPDNLTVAVNLSPKQFENADICSIVAGALDDAGLAPARLELEITEGILLNDTDSVIAQLQQLKQLGVSIAMDDFGTGYSSLSYLWRFPFDKLKIDRSFMDALGERDDSVINIMKTIVSLGRTLNLQVTAEGIETEDQADILRDLNCDQLQGFHFGRPEAEEDVAATILQAANQGLAQASAEREGLPSGPARSAA